MFRIFSEKEAINLETHLLSTSDGQLICSDSGFFFDDAAQKRQPDLFALRDSAQEIREEVEAEKYGLVYVRMDGNIGNVVNGAGLAMATNDAISLYGGTSANFLDAGGQATKETMLQAFGIIMRDERVKAILVNIYGGITRCDMIAESIIAAASELGPLRVPMVVRLQGTNSEAGLKLLSDTDLGIHVEADFALLNDDLEFTALSYTWGDADDTLPITVNGCPFQATRNLVAALRQLQEDDKTVTLWIDAICIQQSNNAEKSWQIQLMKDIFEKATTTMVWLGEDPESAAIVQAFSRISQRGLSWDSNIWDTSDAVEWLQSSPELLGSPLGGPVQAAIYKLLNLDYWFRVWCLQEFLVSRDITVACGNNRVSLSDFNKFATTFLQLFWRHHRDALSRQDLLTIMTNNPTAPPGSLAPEVNGATRMCLQREKYRSSSAGTPGQPLVELLTLAFSHTMADDTLHSTDPRDRVFGLLNIASDAKELDIRPNYDKSCEEVFLETWAAILAKDQAALLVYPQYGRSPQSPSSSALRGVEVDAIGKVGTILAPVKSIPEQGFKPVRTFLTEIELFVQESCSAHPDTPVYAASEAAASLYRIPIGDREKISPTNPELQRATTISAERLEATLTVIKAYHDVAQSRIPEKITQFSMTLLQSMGKFDIYLSTVMMHAGWKPFLSVGGYVGLGPDAMDSGDVIAIFHGAHVPFVLRPKGQEFQLLGEAYVHGIMDGEFMQVDREDKTFRLC
ncbi:hypothetical protein CEP52_003424 [Fusarium oligoseptatum]|uniref:Heterokaryon incompatibility domain-containing protein n=1 Tax=Fusarium oligoseptatum TaxID=2604345 RepID=A0A428U8V2_9HYPO|nr:hypothetical protein CEP52_003424 [Fusarium oligoseptatum]